MNDRTELLPTVLARALWTLSSLLLVGRVEQGSTWRQSTLTLEPVIKIEVTGYPTERDELLAAMPGATPEDWQNSEGRTYRDWRGQLLTMSVTVQETLSPESAAAGDAEPPASDPAGVIVPPLPGWFDDEHGHVVPLGPGFSGPGGPFPAEQVDDPDAEPEPVDEPDAEPVDEPEPEPVDVGPYGVANWRAPLSDFEQRAGVDEPPAVERGHTTRDLTARYAGVAGVTVVAGRDLHAENVALWGEYARGRCLIEHRGQRFPTVDDAVTAINLWPGRDMLEYADVVICAQRLANSPEPPRPPRQRGRLLRLMPRGFHRDGASVVGG